MTEAIGAILAVLAASLLGSLHCAGMCGGLVLFAVGADCKLERRWSLHAAYHAARGLAYTALGAGAGLIGAGIDTTTMFGAGSRTSAIIAGVLIVLLGIMSLAAYLGANVRALRMPRALQRFAERAHRRAFDLPPVHRAAAVGLLTPLLPCGWLYAFVIIAAGTGSLLFGAAVMLAFWLGTVPVLAGVGLGLQRLSAPLRARLPLVTSVVVVAIGLMTAMGRVSLPIVAPKIDGLTVDEQINSASNLGHEDLPCCNPTAETPG